MEKTLQQRVADEIIKYPLDILEYIVEKGRERIAKENKRQVSRCADDLFTLDPLARSRFPPPGPEIWRACAGHLCR